jgi:hypothetical protein
MECLALTIHWFALSEILHDVMLARHFAQDRWGIAERGKESVRGIQSPGRSRRAKPKVRTVEDYQSTNGDSPCHISSNPSPERIDEMFRGESPLVDENSRFEKINHCS